MDGLFTHPFHMGGKRHPISSATDQRNVEIKLRYLIFHMFERLEPICIIRPCSNDRLHGPDQNQLLESRKYVRIIEQTLPIVLVLGFDRIDERMNNQYLFPFQIFRPWILPKKRSVISIQIYSPAMHVRRYILFIFDIRPKNIYLRNIGQNPFIESSIVTRQSRKNPAENCNDCKERMRDNDRLPRKNSASIFHENC